MATEPVTTIIGNLTADPELRHTANGTPVAGFTVAATPRYRNNQTGAWEDGETLFMRVSAWRELGEHAMESLTRGTRVIVTGRLRSRTYEAVDKDTGIVNERTVIEMTADDLGPSLRFANARVTKATRTTTGTPGGEPDPWTTHPSPAGHSQPTTPAPAGQLNDPPPF
ncbi:single-stranded DNA-binding protein [Bailinhaonella thermotolerans]|uniref:Single-stranded DNA-binding protein n=1 Tax=Bailinhaonella thermotolerans TaxID=1070861 RepID=A0A3A3ZXE1_9ACTN|nr:single-stranded DNA-binding protein [Bailinhaonella thermotolerans]RJL19578.1 single-stranded DNA-binding protein [Bailinhaonella thermotolerans]